MLLLNTQAWGIPVTTAEAAALYRGAAMPYAHRTRDCFWTPHPLNRMNHARTATMALRKISEAERDAALRACGLPPSRENQRRFPLAVKYMCLHKRLAAIAPGTELTWNYCAGTAFWQAAQSLMVVWPRSRA